MNHLLYIDLTNLVQTQNFASQILRLNRCNALRKGANHSNRRKSLRRYKFSNPRIIKSSNL